MNVYICFPVTIIITFFAFVMFKNTFGTMSVGIYMPHMHMFYFQLIIMTAMGILFVQSGIRSNVLDVFGITEKSIFLSIIVIWYLMLALPIAIRIFGKKINVKGFLEKNIVAEGINIDKMFFRVCTFVALFCVFYCYMHDAPLFQLIKGSGQRVLIMRVSYGREFGGSYFIKNVLGESIVIGVSYILFLYYRSTKAKYWRNLFFINFICAIIISGASLSKSGIVNYLIPYIFLSVANGFRIRMKKWMKWGLIGIVIVLIMYGIQTSGELGGIRALFDFYRGPIGRILFVQIQSLPAYFMIFPNMHPYTLGKGIALFRFIGLPHIESARVVAEYLEPVGVSQGWVGVANTIFLGDAYANFGWLGIIVSPFIVALWHIHFYKKMVSEPKTPFRVGLYITILTQLTNGLTGGFCSAYIINTRVIALYVLGIVYGMYRTIVRRKFKVYTVRRLEV